MMVSNSGPVPEGTVIMADHQYAGRGQQGNTWHSEPGLNLTCSIVLYPEFLDVSNQYLLNMAVCVAVRDAASSVLEEGVMIKWPNDIYHSDKKLGGILIENAISGKKYKSAIIGIGLNVNQEYFSEGQVKAAISFREILGRELKVDDLLKIICHHLEVQYMRLRDSADELTDDYHNGLYRLGTPALFEESGRIFEATIKGVSKSGRLMLQTTQGVKEYGLKEVVFLT